MLLYYSGGHSSKIYVCAMSLSLNSFLLPPCGSEGTGKVKNMCSRWTKSDCFCVRQKFGVSQHAPGVPIDADASRPVPQCASEAGKSANDRNGSVAVMLPKMSDKCL
jgi:hypothetical protein